MKKYIFGAAMVVTYFVFIISEVGALSTNYAEVLVENLSLGQPVSMVKSVNMPLIIGNSSDKPIKVKIEVIKPDTGELKKGFEPIPNVNWINIGDNVVNISPQSKHKADVKITIPDEDKYLGRKFHVTIWSYEVGQPGFQITVGVKARLLFTTAPVRQNPALNPPVSNLNYKLHPGVVNLKDIRLGKKFKIRAPENKPIEIENSSSSRMKFMLQSISPRETIMTIPKGMEACPDPDFLTIEKEVISIPGNKRKKVDMFLEIPDQPEYRGKKYIFILNVSVGPNANVSRHLRIYVTTPERK